MVDQRWHLLMFDWDSRATSGLLDCMVRIAAGDRHMHVSLVPAILLEKSLEYV